MTTVRDSKWWGQTVEATLRRETNSEGEDPILSKEMFEAILAQLNRPERTSTAQSRQHYQPEGRGVGLLSGVARCGACGGTVMRVGTASTGLLMI